MKLSDPVSYLSRTSALTIKKMRAAGIETIRDLLILKPNRYEDFRTTISAQMLQDGLKGTCTGTVEAKKQLYTRSRITIQQVILRDSTGTILIQFFNQSYILKTIQTGSTLSCSGVVKQFGNKLMFIPTTYELGLPAIHTGKLLPIYPELRGMSTRLIREKIHNILNLAEDIEEYLPTHIINNYKLTSLNEAVSLLHNPTHLKDVERATHRLAFEELLKIQIATRKLRHHWNSAVKKVPILLTQKEENVINRFISDLPFKLTPDQLKAFKAIQNDFSKNTRMNRFLQGDVGSGKTIVAVLAALHIYLGGKKTLYMAPTEILAEQQYNTFRTLLDHLGISISLITGSRNTKLDPQSDIYIGTHALLTKVSHDKNIGLIIIDEQHRFGVKQRALLSLKGNDPHLLTMTATPIPRTVALTLFGDLDMSVIQTMPVGRKSIKTILVTESKRKNAYEWMNKEIETKSIQIFVVCPLIESSQSETLQSVKSATEEYDRLKKEIFPHRTVALLHGRLKSEEKSRILHDFASNKISVLVTTSVVEVGIDIPNCTIMCIEGAERFGLAQLHQLRGRIGRGQEQSYCLLFPTDSSLQSERLQFFAQHTNGMELAEFDLKKRGPGSLYGFEQHGYLDVQFTTLSDTKMIEETQEAADYLITHWDETRYPEFLQSAINYQKELVAKD